MAFREFMDSAGSEWQVYDVIPRDERRSYDRRVSDPDVDLDEDRRLRDDRRVTIGRTSQLAAVSQGWLCFERSADRERRRLSPIPAGWLEASDLELERHLEAARVVPPMPLDSAAGEQRR